jgi:prophage DNA circulation protein
MSADPLLEQLVDMRAKLVGDLAKRIDGGWLALLNSVGGAIRAVEAERRAPVDADQAVRAVVSDPPGEPMELTLYRQDGTAAAMPLTPLRALALAGDLVRAATSRLG